MESQKKYIKGVKEDYSKKVVEHSKKVKGTSTVSPQQIVKQINSQKKNNKK